MVDETQEAEQTQEQEAMTVSPDMLLAQIVAHVGEEFVIIPTEGWMQIVNTLTNFEPSDDQSLIDELEGLGVPVVPVSLAGRSEEDESSIIMPNDAPDGESRIIMPNEGESYPEGGIIKP